MHNIISSIIRSPGYRGRRRSPYRNTVKTLSDGRCVFHFFFFFFLLRSRGERKRDFSTSVGVRPLTWKKRHSKRPGNISGQLISRFEISIKHLRLDPEYEHRQYHRYRIIFFSITRRVFEHDACSIDIARLKS